MNQAEAIARYARFHGLLPGKRPIRPLDGKADPALVVVRDLGLDPDRLLEILTSGELLAAIDRGFPPAEAAPLVEWLEEREGDGNRLAALRERVRSLSPTPAPPDPRDEPIRVTRPDSNETFTYRATASGEAPSWATGSTVEILMDDDARAAARQGEAARRRRRGAGERQRFGRYEILEEIARGGMGVIYKARQVGLDRVVALKVIRAGPTASREEIDRFEHEARAAARLHHPGIVPIFDLGVQAGLCFYSMALIGGKTLQEAMDRPGFLLHRGVKWIMEVCEAVHYAHINGITHRDLKPSNILIDEEGRALVGDFGLSKDLTQKGSDHPGSPVGTPKYMAPEQLVGKGDPRSDVYALGVILYEMASGGELPYVGTTPIVMMLNIQKGDRIALSQRGPKVSRDLIRLIDAAIMREPRERYQSARDLGQELERFVNGLPLLGPMSRGKSSTARRIAIEVDRVKKLALRHWKAALAVAIIFGALVFLWLRERSMRVDAERRADPKTRR